MSGNNPQLIKADVHRVRQRSSAKILQLPNPRIPGSTRSGNSG
jgi:hypothetical protein